MKHFEKKFVFAGSGSSSGGSTPPKPPTLKPPYIGSYKVGASFQFSETIDLISDGPIEGLCNKYGKVLDNKELLQGIFLNNVPIQEPIKRRGRIRVLGGQSYESQSSDPFKENINYLFQDLVAGGEDLTSQEARQFDSLGAYPTEDCRTEQYDTGSTRSRRIFGSRPRFCRALNRRRCTFRRSRSSIGSSSCKEEVILTDENFYNAAKAGKGRYDTDNVIEQSNLTFGRDTVISYFANSTMQRELSVPFNYNDYNFRKKGGVYGREYYIDSTSTVANDIDYRQDASTRLGWITWRKNSTGWDSFVNKDADKYWNDLTTFYRRSGVSYINKVGQMESNAMIEYGQTYANIRERLFSLNTRVYKDKPCVYPYNDCTLVHDQSYTSVLRQGTTQLIDIVNKKNTNPFEYAFLKKQMESLGWSVPNTMTMEWMIEKFETNIASRSQFIAEIKGTSEAVFSPPFLAFKFRSDYVIEGYQASQDKTFINSYGDINPYELDMVSSKEKNSPRYSINFLIPQLDKDTGEWNGKVRGFYFSPLEIDVKSVRGKLVLDDGKNQTQQFKFRYKKYASVYATAMKSEELNFLKGVTDLGLFQNQYKVQGQEVDKYNYGNVLAEFRKGEGPNQQAPLSYFKDVYIEHDLTRKLIGPFNTNNQRRIQTLLNWDVRGVDKRDNGTHKMRSLSIADQETVDGSRTSFIRFLEGIVIDGSGGYLDGITVRNVPSEGQVPDMVKNWTVAVSEGSLDQRPNSSKKFDFSGWNSFKKNFDEKAQPVTHIITNPNAQSLYFTINIINLYDTLHRDASTTTGDNLGKKIPSVVNIRIEIGYIEPSVSEEDGFVAVYDRFFRIASLVEQRAPLDIGNPDNNKALIELDYVEELYKDTSGSEKAYKGGVGEPFDLPAALVSDETGQEKVFRERYIKISKLSTESNSTLVFKNLEIGKVVEIISSNFNYPYSSIIGTKIDSRSFQQIPTRSFEARLKRIKIPSNYTPLREDGTDRRFWDDASKLQQLGKVDDILVYDGDWDGQFKIGWTDNPAWIIYDLLTSTRYGLGEFLKPEDINKWQLYKIARFCDAVDKDGYFVGVDTNQTRGSKNLGQREPRYSCNMMFTSALKAYDALNMISSIFKGMVYYSNSSVSFADDTIKEPVLMFNNSNVENGFFEYSNQTRDKQFNAVEVSYLDRDDNYRNKIEYIEDEEDVARRGVFKTVVDAYGTTSRSQAVRHAKHIMYATTKENQSVSFITSLEGLLCKPGDLIIIEDDLKSLTNNFGKVLDVNSSQGKVKLSESYSNSSSLEDKITFYIPTGRQSVEDLDNITSIRRNRFLEFEVASDNASWTSKKLNGSYGFSRYEEGFEDITQNYKKEQYPVYTGTQDGINHFLWYSTQYSGWVFSTGKSFQHNNTYDKYIQEQYYNGDLVQWLPSFNNKPISWYQFDSNQADGRGVSSLTLQGDFYNLSATDGVVESDININETKQILDFSTTSYINDDFGSTWTIDPNDENYNLMPLIPEGSTYRIRRKNTDDQIYKVMGITELETNKYQIVGGKYISGKYLEMESFAYKDIEDTNSPYRESAYEAEGRSFVRLKTPQNFSIAKTPIGLPVERVNFITSWTEVANATGYRLELKSSSLSETLIFSTLSNGFTIKDITENGGYLLSVTATGPSYSSSNPEISYLESNPITRFINVNDFEENLITDGSFVSNISIS